MRYNFEPTPRTSKTMAAIRGKDTRVELALRKSLWDRGIRGYRKYPNLPGKPDLFFPRCKLVVFIDGCFWHGCPLHYREPKRNVLYWRDKVQKNKDRDKENSSKLESAGYTVIRFWEHQIREDLAGVVNQLSKKTKC